MDNFTQWVDLASERVGGAVLWANDEFFAPKESLLVQAAPIFEEHRYTERGKWMDGWETRRRRSPGHDTCIIRLGLPGVIRGVVADTAFFRGNFPESCSIEALSAPFLARPDELQQRSDWTEILPASNLQGDAPNSFAVESPKRWTHIRFNIFPDGGVARLRVYGDVMPNWERLTRFGGLVDLGAMENGAQSIDCSDMFFSDRRNLILPGHSVNMGDGWETKRRRGPGHDWVVVRLGRRGTLRRVVVDTSHYKGNAPDHCRVEVCDLANAADYVNGGEGLPWKIALPQAKLQPHTVHSFEDLEDVGPCTHVRLSIHPDGGVARLRLWGEVDA